MTAYAPERTDRVVATGRYFRPGDPVRTRVVHRDRRVLVSDEGAAIERAGRTRRWEPAARRIADEFLVNISRSGVVSLPVVRLGPPEEEIVSRIAEESPRRHSPSIKNSSTSPTSRMAPGGLARGASKTRPALRRMVAPRASSEPRG